MVKEGSCVWAQKYLAVGLIQSSIQKTHGLQLKAGVQQQKIPGGVEAGKLWHRALMLFGPI